MNDPRHQWTPKIQEDIRAFIRSGEFPEAKLPAPMPVAWTWTTVGEAQATGIEAQATGIEAQATSSEAQRTGGETAVNQQGKNNETTIRPQRSGLSQWSNRAAENWKLLEFRH